MAPSCFRTLKSFTSGSRLEDRKRIYLLQNIAFKWIYIAPAKRTGLGEMGNTLLSWAAPASHRSTAQNQKVYLLWVLAISATLGRCRDLTKLLLLLRAARIQHTKQKLTSNFTPAEWKLQKLKYNLEKKHKNVAGKSPKVLPGIEGQGQHLPLCHRAQINTETELFCTEMEIKYHLVSDNVTPPHLW